MSSDARPGRRQAALRVLLWLLGIGLALAATARLAAISAQQLDAPFDLSFETPSLRPIELLQEGRDPYDAAVYAAPPFWISPYMPLYSQLVAALPADPGNPFVTGRIVSLGCMLLAAASLFVVGGRALPLSLLAFAAFFLIRPSAAVSTYLKCDALALLCSVVTLLAVQRGARDAASSRRRLWIVLGALAGTAAFLSKQSFVAASLAAGLWLLLVDRRGALLFAGLHALFVAAALAWLWSDGFVFSVFLSLQNAMSFEQFTGWWAIMAGQPVLMLLVAWSLGAAAVAFTRPRRSGVLRAPFALYGLTATLVLCATLGKEGSWLNYFLEPALACLLALVEAGRHAAPRVLPASAIAALLLLAASVYELVWEPDSGDVPVRFATAETRAHREQQLGLVADAIESLGVPDPLILNLYDTTLSYPLPGTICASDTYHYFLLYESGRLSTGPVVAAIAAHQFDGVLFKAELLDAPAPSSPMGAIHRALQQNYRVGLALGPMDYLVPKADR